MTWYIHINRNTINSNRKNGTDLPAVRVQKGKRGKPKYAHRVKFSDGEVIYQPSGAPLLPCGARLIIQTDTEPVIL